MQGPACVPPPPLLTLRSAPGVIDSHHAMGFTLWANDYPTEVTMWDCMQGMKLGFKQLAWLGRHCWTLLPFPPQAFGCLNLFT